MATYYFTYGIGDPNNQDYVGGWTEVEADSIEDAITAYKMYHPVNEHGALPCCGVAYSREQMAKPYKYAPGSMLEDGNGGKYCHDRITLKREVMDE